MRISLALVALLCEGFAFAQPRVAVMDFTAASTAKDLEPLGAGLQSMITTDLGELPTLVLVERARLKEILAELKLADSGAVDKQTAAKLGALAGASHLLAGSFTVVGGKMRIDARLFTVSNGDIVLSEKIEGAQTAFFELEKALVKKIVDTVGVKLTKKERAELQKPKTTNFDAFQKFSQGIVLFDENKRPEAVAAMQAALAKDPSFALAQTKLTAFQTAPPLPPPPSQGPQCQSNPLLSQCQAGSPPTSPTMIASTPGDSRRYSLIVRSSTQEARCATPCQLFLPEGKADVEVVSPVKFHKEITVAGGPTSVSVTSRNKTNLIVGATLTSAIVGMLVATIVLYTYEKPFDPTTSSNSVSYSEYAPIPLALAAGMTYPAIHYLMRIGKNNVSASGL